ncbi:MAG: TonB-dependent receptor [Paucibacter sp.]|nr:TonB-dependent receptor [Roseateles sp.]
MARRHHIHINPRRSFPLNSLLSALLCAAPALAQSTADNQLPPVTVSASNQDAAVAIGGFGSTPLAKLPLQASTVSRDQLFEDGINDLRGLTALDASVSDSYNAIGYISYLNVRGFQLDPRFNYRRDGLPIDADTALALGNINDIEVLKGTSGIQAGTSAPGGLVNLVVKRPTGNWLDASLALSERGTTEATFDWSQRFGRSQGAGTEFGLRINASAADLHPLLNNAEGKRNHLGVAADWRPGTDTLLQAEFEISHQSEPSQQAYSLLGATLPNAAHVDPNLNLNDMPWTEPVVFDNIHASLRWQQKLSTDPRPDMHYGLQRLRSDDREAFAFGCTNSTSGQVFYDRFCGNGDFDLYDFRSNNEHRDVDALDTSLSGRFETAGLQHDFTGGVLLTHTLWRLGPQTYAYAGESNVYSQNFSIPPNPAPNATNTDRHEHTTEFYLRDSIQLSNEWQLFAGLRHTQLHRDSWQTDGTQAAAYGQSFTTPWLGLSYAVSAQQMVYGSWGQGVQSDVAPQLPTYTNAGQALPSAVSRQFELGYKVGARQVDWSIAAFDIEQPQWSSLGACSGAIASCTETLDGTQHNRGLEAQADLKWRDGALSGSAMKLQARREGAMEPGIDGLRPTNAPEETLKLEVRQGLGRLTGWQGLHAHLALVYEGPRAVLPDNSVNIGGWSRMDGGLRFDQTLDQAQLTWRLGVNNVFDRRAWRESPYQYGSAYLYPLAPRTFRLSLEMRL